MANVTIQRTGQFMAELFKLLLEHPGGMQAQAALAELANRVTLTSYEVGHYASGGRRFEKIVRFGTVDCVKAGWLKEQRTLDGYRGRREALKSLKIRRRFIALPRSCIANGRPGNRRSSRPIRKTGTRSRRA